MAEHELIEAYLRELRYSMTRVADAGEVIEEVADHLNEAVAHLVQAGHSHAEAEQEALARFGSAALISKVFTEDRRRRAAVPTSMTRRAGLAALCSPVLLAIGTFGIQNWHFGLGYAAGTGAMGLGVLATLFGFWGFRRRHGGMGAMGRVAFWITLASPLLAAPFGWAAPAALGIVLLLNVVLVTRAMYRAAIFPRVPIALLGIGPFAIIATVMVMEKLNAPSTWWPLSFAPLVVGYVWLGLLMWREVSAEIEPPDGLATA